MIKTNIKKKKKKKKKKDEHIETRWWQNNSLWLPKDQESVDLTVKRNSFYKTQSVYEREREKKERKKENGKWKWKIASAKFFRVVCWK
jgi:hypothetical protein